TLFHDLVIGLRVAYATADDDGPSKPISLKDVEATRAEAKQVLDGDFWQDLESLLRVIGTSCSVTAENKVYMAAAGPLCQAQLALGVKGESKRAGLETFRGTRMDQELHAKAVTGARVGITESYEEIDFSEPAHEARLSATAALKKTRAYFLVARYD